MNDWSNVLDSILDIIPTASEATAAGVTPEPGVGAVDLTSDLDFSAPVSPEMIKRAGLWGPAPLPPMRIVTAKPPLPADMWLNGLTPPAAMAKWRELKQAYFCSCGADATGWFVRCEESKYRLINA